MSTPERGVSSASPGTDFDTESFDTKSTEPACRPPGDPREPGPSHHLPPCPYRGLVPFTEDDAEYFFGRDRDRDLVIANVMASRLTVLYGPSGVGKSSLLQAGVVRRLREDFGADGFSYLAARHVVVAYYAAWTTDPLVGLGSALRDAVPVELAAQSPEWTDLPADAPLSVSLLRQATQLLGADICLLLDQFEEITRYRDRQRVESFAAELGRIVAASGLRVGVLIGIREDALSQLDLFQPYLPGVLNNRLRLDHLDLPAAREAIERPLQRYDEQVDEPDRIQLGDGLVDELLTQLRTGRVTIGDVGKGGVDDGRLVDATTIETPFLQLVMTRLWAAELAEGSTTLRRETLSRLGGAEGIVRSHLGEVMATLTPDQVAVAAQVLRHLVTPSGSKIARSADDLAYAADLPDPVAVTTVLEALSRPQARVLRPVPAPMDHAGSHYEVSHDVLAPAVLEWCRGYFAAQERAEAEAELVQAREQAEAKALASRRALRRRLLTGVLVGLLLAGLVVTGGFLLRRDREAALQDSLVKYQREIVRDPDQALRYAIKAYDIDPAEADTAVRAALEADLSERTLLSGATGQAPTVVGYSRDGSRVVIAGQDGTVRVMDAGTGQPVAILPAETAAARSPLTDASFSPDGSQLVAVSESGRIRVMEARTGRPTRVIDDYHQQAQAAWGSVAGRVVLLVSASCPVGGSNPPATLYDGATGQLIRRFAAPGSGRPGTGGVYQTALSPDGRRLVSYGSDATVSVWDIDTGHLLARSSPVGTGASQPQFVTAQSNRIVLLRKKPGLGEWQVGFWTWNRGTAPGALQINEDSFAEIQPPEAAVSPDRGLVAVGLDKRVRLYDAGTGRSEGFAFEHPDQVTMVTWSPDGHLLATAGEDGRIRVWSPGGSNRAVAQLLGHRGSVRDIAFRPTDSGDLLSASRDGTARNWRLPIRMVLPNGDPVLRASASRDGRTVLTASQQGTLRIWEPGLNSSQPVRTIALPRDSAFSFLKDAVIAPDGNTVVAIRERDSAPLVARRRDSGTSESVLPLSPPTPRAGIPSFYFSSLAVSPDGREAAAGNGGNEVVVWDLTTRQVIRKVPRGGAEPVAVTALAYVGGAGQLAAASMDGTIRIWDPGQQRPRLTLELPNHPIVWSIAVSPDRRWLAATAEDHKLRIWRLTDGHPETEMAGPTENPAGLGFSPDGSLLAVGASDGAVHVYDWRAKQEKQERGTLYRHGDTVNDVHFLSDGRILSASDDGTAALYPCTVMCRPIREVARQAEARIHQMQRS